MLCEEIMKRDVRSLAATDSPQFAARLMRDSGIGFAPILDRDGRVIGVLTDRDITVRFVASNGPAANTVTQIMTREVVACRPEDDVERAQQLMAEHCTSRVLCTNVAGMPQGVISLSDIARHAEPASAVATLCKVSERAVHSVEPRWAVVGRR